MDAEDEDEEESDWTARMKVEDLEVGQELNGIVNTVVQFGVFVDVGADRDGLVHISRVSDGFVDDIESIVEPGQAVKVWVMDVSADGKLGLTMVKDRGTGAAATADLDGFKELPTDELIDGTVTAVTDFGLFVTVAPPGGGPTAQGLVHISQIREGFVEHPADEAEVGQKVKVRVLEADPGKGRLKLTMRDAGTRGDRVDPGSQDLSSFEGVAPSTLLKGTVHHVAPFGIFVDVEAPSGETVQGMVHVTEIREGFVDDPATEAEVGQEVTVRVVSVDTSSGRLGLSMKPEAAQEGA